MEIVDSFIYCSRCGKKLKKKNPRLIHCDNCAFHFYFTPYPTNALIIENKNGEILLVKRKYPPKKGYWDLPGGFVKFEENMEESTKREIKEELGLELNDFQYITSVPDRYLYKGINYQTLIFIYATRIGEQKMEPYDDITVIKSFPKDKIPYGRIAFAGIKKALKIYLSSFQKSYSPKNGK